MSALDAILSVQRANDARRNRAPKRTRLLIWALAAFVYATCCIGVTHHFFTFQALMVEDENIGFTFIAVPLAFLLGLRRFDFAEMAICLGSCMLGATIALVVAHSRFIGWAVIYELMSGNFQAAFMHYPSIFLNILIATFGSIIAWIIGLVIMDYAKPLA